jgi:phosphatidylserine/phosphatidylglycerophosphate/cardiolipin synthase-like enzyme
VESNWTEPGQAAPATAEPAPAVQRDVDKWFLTAQERGNPHTELDSRHADGAAWSTGNLVRPLVHGAVYFSELLAAIRRMGTGDQLMLTDWRGDPDELLEGPGTEVGSVLAEAARRGVVVRALVWRSHMDRMRYHEGVNRRFGEQIHAAGGECLLDQRVRAGGSHHQKLVVLRHPGRPEDDVAFIGGIDLCHGRKDDRTHAGDLQPCPIGAVYGSQPPWHDVQVAIHGPAVADVETAFRERWDDPAPLTRNPYRRWRDRALRPHGPRSCPSRLPDPPACGTDAVQILRTYPYRRGGYAFAPTGERSIARAYRKALAQARRLIYLEDQYIWSPHVVCVFADALAANPDLRMIAVVPQFPDRDSPAYNAPQLLARGRSLEQLARAGGERVAVYGIENPAGIPVYVHAKVCVVDDEWTSIGSDNVNMRSWTHDSELSCAVVDQSPTGDCFALRLRLALAGEHLDRDDGDHDDLGNPIDLFEAFAQTAKELDAWHAAGRPGPRPPGRLRRYQTAPVSRLTASWARPLHRLMYDPDGRPRTLRRQGGF